MTLEELKARVIFQINADLDDLGDYEPHLSGYVNQGYDKLAWALLTRRLGSRGLPVLEADSDVPVLPDWMHPAMADYATWLVYRNGNPQKQQRGMQFLQAFNEVLQEAKGLAGRVSFDEETGELTVSDKTPQFFNVYP